MRYRRCCRVHCAFSSISCPPQAASQPHALHPYLPQMLLLGFGDVRNVLSTASACAADPKSARCRQLCFHLNDISPLNVARGLLLLHLVRVLPGLRQGAGECSETGGRRPGRRGQADSKPRLLVLPA